MFSRIQCAILATMIEFVLFSSASIAGSNLDKIKDGPVLYDADRDSYGYSIRRYLIAIYYQNSKEKMDLKLRSDKDYCSGPLYECSGIMISGFEQDGDYWKKPYPQQQKISLSYWSEKTNTATFADPLAFAAAYERSGYMLWPSDIVNEHYGANVFKPHYSCVFSADAGTEENWGNGCAMSGPTCQELGIYTAQDYLNHYGNDPTTFPAFCGWSLGEDEGDNKRYFGESIKLQLNQGRGYDEVVAKGWDEYNPSKIPLMGFFYYDDYDNLDSSQGLDLTQVQKQQLDYYKETGIFVPIIHPTSTSKEKGWSAVDFKYNSSEQSPGIPQQVKVIVKISS